MTNRTEINYSDIHLSELTDILEEYQGFKISRHLPDIIHSGMETLIKIKGAKTASLFIINSDFDFEHRTTLPFNEKNSLLKFYDKLVESQKIGETLSKGEISYYSSIKEDLLDYNVLICPLKASSGIIGMVIITFLEDCELFKKANLGFFKIWLELFACHIENNNLNKTIEQNQSLLEQKLAARTMSIAQSKRELQAILNAVQTAILVIDPDTKKIITANPVAAMLIGDKQENIVGKDAKEFFKADAERYLDDDKVKFSRNFESTITTTRNTQIPILRSIANINIGNQSLRIESFLDITERKMNEIALKQANELLELKVQERTEDLQILIHKLRDEIHERERVELEVRKMLAKELELNDMKSKFVSLVSHEFRTPLTIIRSAAQILEKFKNQITPDQIEEYLQRIVTTVDNMTDLMENVLFIGRSDNKKNNFSPRLINIKTYSEGIVRDIILVSKSNNEIRLSVNTDEEVYYFDDTLIRQVLFNLLTNAIKYSKGDSPVEMKVFNDQENIYFEVTDYGIGIAEEEQDMIFDLFYRGSNVGTISGTGLGMTVVVRSLAMHKGRIELESKAGTGSTFKVSIPIIKEKI